MVWPDRFEKQRRVMLSAGMMGVFGRVQREGEVVHLLVHRVTDLSEQLATLEDRHEVFPVAGGRGDQAESGGATDSRETLAQKVRNIHVSSQPSEAIEVKTRDFR